MNIRWPTLIASALALACMTTASADDGEKMLKEMTGGSTDGHLTVAPEDIGHYDLRCRARVYRHDEVLCAGSDGQWR